MGRVGKHVAAPPGPGPVLRELAEAVAPSDRTIPEGVEFSNYDNELAGAPYYWDDYQPGEKIDHVDGCMLEQAEHMMATRLWQNTARVHFDPAARGGEPRLVYGGHIISMARALSFNGLGNAQLIAGINGGTHAAPCFAGDTVYAWSEVLDRAETSAPSVGALRLRLVAVKNAPAGAMVLRGPAGRYAPGVVLDFDYCALPPSR